ncbi:MAG: CZB domain-containing protein [Pelagimonas sp.]|uniref:CZB domain-containing protein n=1 Tax=Pelagimonas sp. TaxID=2073170 RepID=UPI003D6B94DC
MNKPEIEENVGKALVAHSQWKVRLRHAVQTGQLPKPAKDIACDDQCGLGLWISGSRKNSELMGLQEFQAVAKAHSHFHKEAGRIAEMVERGNQSTASDELDGPAYSKATDALKTALISLRRLAQS